MFGFDQTPPALLTLLNALKDQGCQVTQVDPIEHNSSPRAIACNTTEDELDLIAQWSLEMAQQGVNRIGVVLPSLAEHKPKLQSLLNHYQPDGPRQYNFSSGDPLTQYAIVQCALDILRLPAGPIEVDRLYQCLLSPYVHPKNEHAHYAARIDRKIREQYSQTIHFSYLFYVISKNPAPAGNTLTQRLRDFYQHYNQNTADLTASQWATHWVDMLKAIGWPGGRPLNSEEYQISQRFYTALDEFSTLNTVYNTLSYSHALSLFQQQLAAINFQTEGSIAPIQILGTLEASGLEFDQVWFASLDIDSWPHTVTPHPFIPHALQRQFDLPQSSTEKELIYCKTITKRILSSADISYCSWAENKGEKSLIPSSLVKNIMLFKAENLNLPLNINKVKNNPNNNNDIEKILDSSGPPINSSEPIQGGTAILKSQANCPFQGFAQFRLKATALPTPSLGLNPMQRGNLIHTCLEMLWNEIQSHAQLCQLKEEELDQRITNIVEQVVSDFSRHSLHFKNHYFVHIERKRLIQLMKNWLEFEKKRPPFDVVANELKHNITVGPLSLNLKVDRIDKLSNGQHLIIDYKTGKTQVSGWFGSTLIDPQLPLYCAYGNPTTSVEAISFAEVRTQGMQFKGIASETLEDKPAGIQSVSDCKLSDSSSWKTTLALWQQQIAHLSHAFANGDAAIAPHSPQSCRYCDLHSLCRNSIC